MRSCLFPIALGLVAWSSIFGGERSRAADDQKPNFIVINIDDK